jgi:hypothetical protein
VVAARAPDQEIPTLIINQNRGERIAASESTVLTHHFNHKVRPRPVVKA